jgi:MFS family permease
MSGLLVNPVFVKRFYSDYGGADGSTAAVNPSVTGISVACLQASAALGALIAGRLGDMIGRKRTVRLGGFIYFFSAFIQIFAPGFGTFVAGRTIQGLGVGFLSMTVPIIQTEIAAPHARGLMVGIEYTCLIAGYMLSCWVDYGFHFMLPDNMSWQGPFIIQILLSFLLVVISFFLPETPRWLAMNGFMQESLQTVADLHSNGDTEAEHVQKVFLEIQEAVVYEAELGKAGWIVSLRYSLHDHHSAYMSLSGNVHSLSQTHHRRYHSPDVRPAERYQHHLVLPAKHPLLSWLRRQDITAVHRCKCASIHSSNSGDVVAGRSLGP